MKIFLLEYITAGGLNRHPLHTSLLEEAMLIRDALLHDYRDVANVEIVTTYDVRLPKPSYAEQAIAIDATINSIEVWRMLLEQCDGALVVAPETEHILANLTDILEKSPAKNFGSDTSAVEICSDKYLCYKHLKSADILTIPTYRQGEVIADSANGYVIKPRDGAGCENTQWVKDKGALTVKLADGYIIQPYQPGITASISVFFTDGDASVMTCNLQKISRDVYTGYFKFEGCIVNTLPQYHMAFTGLVKKIATAIPGLKGYAGVDVIIDNDQIYVVEINPRITTSYIALREILNQNPAELILKNALSTKPEKLFQPTLTAHTVEVSVHG